MSACKRTWNLILLSAIVSSPFAAPHHVAAQDLAAGRELAEELCAPCHAIARFDQSELPAAPPFRDIAERYSVWLLEEALAEGIFAGHPEMPEFRLEPEAIDNLLGYMATLEPGDPE